MVLHEGDDDEATTTSQTSATSESISRTLDSSANVTPSAGTPSDSLDRNIDPKQMMSSSNDTEKEIQVPLVNNDTLTELKQMSDCDKMKLDNEKASIHDANQDSSNPSGTNEVILQTPPPTYSTCKQDSILVDKLETNGNIVV